MEQNIHSLRDCVWCQLGCCSVPTGQNHFRKRLINSWLDTLETCNRHVRLVRPPCQDLQDTQDKANQETHHTMNLELLGMLESLSQSLISKTDPFANSIPEVIEDTLEEGFATCCAFNRRGTLLATGCYDGRVVVWDFDTRGSSRVYNHHKQAAVTSVSWSRNGRKLLSTSTDCSAKLVDVLSGTVEYATTFGSMVIQGQMNPKKLYVHT